MTYKQLAEDALGVAKNASTSTQEERFLRRAQVFATLALVEQQRIGNLLRYATDFTEDGEYRVIGDIARADLNLPARAGIE